MTTALVLLAKLSDAFRGANMLLMVASSSAGALRANCGMGDLAASTLCNGCAYLAFSVKLCRISSVPLTIAENGALVDT
jgi:hypothetical protein